MRKYAFRKGDVVRARSVIVFRSVDGEKIVVPEDEESIVGRVLSFGSSAGHDWYKVASGGDVYNCRDDELELVMRKRFALRREIPPIDENELERFLLIWRPMSVDPPKDEECAVIWKSETDVRRMDILRWDGEDWIMERSDGGEWHLGRDAFTAWALWEWPETDGKEAGDHDADPDDGQAGD